MIRHVLLLIFLSGIGVFTMSCENAEKDTVINTNDSLHDGSRYYKSLDDTVELSIYDTVTYASELGFLVLRDINDSRCPKGAYCYTSGYARVKFKGSFKSIADTFEMTFPGNPKMKNGYSIKITDVSPYPEIGKASEEAKKCKLILGKPTGLIPATVKDYTGLDACGYIIELDSGTKLEPAVIDPGFMLKDKQRVMLKYVELKDRASACMVGTIARITEIYEIVE